MNHIFTGQIKGRRHLCFACFFFISLFFHQFRTRNTQLHPCKGVNGVINASVIRTETAEHLTVGSIYNSVTPKRGNITLPKIEALLYRL